MSRLVTFAFEPQRDFLGINLPEVIGFLWVGLDLMEYFVWLGVIIGDGLFWQKYLAVIGVVVNGQGYFLEVIYSGHMARYEEFVNEFVLFDPGRKLGHICNFEFRFADLDVRKIIEFLQIGKRPFFHGIDFSRFELAIAVLIVFGNDHVAEHLIKDPQQPDPGQTFFIEYDLKTCIGKDMRVRGGMQRQ